MKLNSFLLSLILFTQFEVFSQQSETIDVNGHGQGLTINNTANSAGTYIKFLDHDGKKADIASFSDDYQNPSYSNAMLFFARNGKDIRYATSTDGSAGTNRLVIKNNGLIGIGTNSPSDGLLHIFKNATTGGIESPNVTNAGIRVQDSNHSLYVDGNSLYTSGNMIMGTISATTLTLGTNNQSRLRINEHGQVGIGKLNATESILNVYRNTTIGSLPNPNLSNSVLKIEDNAFSLYLDGNAIISDASSSSKFTLGTTGSSHLVLGTNSQERFRISNNGNVGIGTTNPTEKLEVAGTIYSREVKVEVAAGTGPDYVFEPTYNLRSLEETEAYIKTNKHLPEIPSAKEIEANGVQLGEMNMLLLKKIEELTLHAIAQEKRISQLEPYPSLLKEREAKQGELEQKIQQLIQHTSQQQKLIEAQGEMIEGLRKKMEE